MQDPHNPFAASDAVAPAAGAGMEPLYGHVACMIVTFFATPLGAAPLLMINASRTHQNPFAVGGLAAALFVGVFLVGMLPLPLPNLVFTLAQVLGVKAIHDSYFKLAMAERSEAGIPFAPWLHAALLCLVGFTLQMLIVGLLIWVFGLDGLAEL